MTEAADDAKRLIGEFNAALQRGEDPDIESCVKRLADRRQRAQLLVALIDVEARHHIARGGDVSVETYLARFPALRDEKLAPARQFITQKTEQYKRELNAARVPASPAGADMTVSSDGHIPPTHTQDPAVTQTQASNIPSPGLINAAASQPRYIGKYLVIAELDRGGQATVFRAAHPQLGTEVAIKMFHSRHPQSVERLHNEGRTLAALRHPGIASVYDLDIHDGQPFVVMEFVRGRNLAQYAADETVPPDKACAIIAKVARALAVAHRAGVLHLDIKPHNILIDSDGEPRLIDFGLARFRQSLGEEKEHPSRLIGTLLYMSPEQAAAKSDLLTARSDIFALGCVLFELLTGQRPYTGASKGEVLERAKQGQVNWQALDDASIPQAMKDVCRKAMAVNPANRFNSAQEMADHLDAAITGPTKRPITPLLIGVGAAVAMVMVIAVSAVMLSSRQTADGAPTPTTAIAPSNDVAPPNDGTTSVDHLNAGVPVPPIDQPPAEGMLLSPLRILVDSGGQARDPAPHAPISVDDAITFVLNVVPPNHDCWIIARDPQGMTRVLARHDVNRQVSSLKLPVDAPPLRLDDVAGAWLFVAVTAPQGTINESLLLSGLRTAGALPAMEPGEIVRQSEGAVARGREPQDAASATAARRTVERTIDAFAASVLQSSKEAGISAVAVTPSTIGTVGRPLDGRPIAGSGDRSTDTRQPPEPPDQGGERGPRLEPRPTGDRTMPPPRPGQRPRTN
jgi:serine/threonine protein kinase